MLGGVRVLVTGGAGFIGSHLVDRLVELGARVRVLDNLSTGKTENLLDSWGSIEFVGGDVRDIDVCRAAAAGAAYVFHQAALGSVPRSMEHPDVTLDVNVRGTANVFTACRHAGVKRVVYASSSSVYGDSEKLPKKEGEEGRPLSPYALSKVMNEELAELFGRCYGIEFIGLRYFNVFGPRQDPEGPYAAVVPRFCKAAAAGEPLLIYGDGDQSRDFTYVSDAVEANILAMTAGLTATGRVYNIAPGNRTTVKDLANVVLRAFGSSAGIRHESPRPGDIRHSQADSSAAREFLGFRASRDLASGIEALVPRSDREPLDTPPPVSSSPP